MTRRGLSTRDFPPEARKRLGNAIQARRLALGFTSRESFAAAVKRATRSIDSLERGQAGVGSSVMGMVSQLFAAHLRGWTTDTPESILNGGPVPEIDIISMPATRVDISWHRAPKLVAEFTSNFLTHADSHEVHRRLVHWRKLAKRDQRTDSEVLDLVDEAFKAAVARLREDERKRKDDQADG